MCPVNRARLHMQDLDDIDAELLKDALAALELVLGDKVIAVLSVHDGGPGFTPLAEPHAEVIRMMELFDWRRMRLITEEQS